jgi:hypothetical protein
MKKVPPEKENGMDRKKLKSKNIFLPSGFSAGFASVVINPEPGTSLGGWGGADKRLSGEILDDIMATCTALCDGENIFLLFSHDALYIRNTMTDFLTEKLMEEYGIPKENVVMNATHTHSAPILHWPMLPGMPKYMERFWSEVLRITHEAICDLSPTTLLAGQTETENMNYVRRYINRKDGSYLGNWPPYQEPAEARHETMPDTQMQVLRFVREEKKDIVLVNWQCHPCSARVAAEKGTVVTSDWIGPFRQRTREQLDVLFAYHQGAAGNLVSSTHILGEKSNTEYRRKGAELTMYLKRALGEAKPMKLAPFRAIRRNHIAKLNEKHAKEDKETEELYLSVLSIGDVAFATAPCELHDTCGKQVKEGSPFPMTFMCGYTNGCFSYIPARFAWDKGGYEVNSCMFVKGSGEKLAGELLDMLDEIVG